MIRVGIIAAMLEEVDYVISSLEERVDSQEGNFSFYFGKLKDTYACVVVCGFGKVNAAAATALLIKNQHVSHVLMIGTAGSLQDEITTGDIVVATMCYQHDFDARPLHKNCVIPSVGTKFISVNSTLSNIVYAAVYSSLNTGGILQNKRAFRLPIGSGDKFIGPFTSRQEVLRETPEVGCVDMETAAVAQVCLALDTPFAAARVISDFADNKASFNFKLFVEEVASKYSYEIVSRFLEMFANGHAISV